MKLPPLTDTELAGAFLVLVMAGIGLFMLVEYMR